MARSLAAGGVDREAAVAALLDQVGDREPQRLRAEALALVRRRDGDVERGVPVHPVRLLAQQQHAGELAADLDRQRRLLAVPDQLADALRVPLLPPRRDGGLGQQREQRVGVVLTDGPERDPIAVQDGQGVHGGSMAEDQTGGLAEAG